MNLKEFYEKYKNTTLITEAYSCETKEEFEALAKANDVELSSEELEKLLSIMKNKTVVLSDDELDVVAGGKLEDYYGRQTCPLIYPAVYADSSCWDCTHHKMTGQAPTMSFNCELRPQKNNNDNSWGHRLW